MSMFHSCSLCGQRKPHGHYPSPIEQPARRVPRTCIECLEKNLTLFDKIDLDHYLGTIGLQRLPPEPVEGENVEDEANVRKRKLPFDGDEEVADRRDSLSPENEGEVSNVPRKARKRPRRNPYAKRKKRPVPELPTELMCRICAEDKGADAFPSVTRRKNESELPQGCQQHLGVRSKIGAVCRDCITEYLSHAVMEGRIEGLGCLEPGCDKVYDERLIQVYLAGTPAFEEYLEQHFRLYIMQSRMLQCVNRKCEGQGLLDIKVVGYPNVQCNECKGRMCANCKVKWHEGKTCQQYRAKYRKSDIDKEERETLKNLADEGYKRCPRCQLAIIKEYGCNHVYCNHCYHQFSYDDAEPVKPLGHEQRWTRPAINSQDWAARAHNADYRDRCEADEMNGNQAARLGQA